VLQITSATNLRARIHAANNAPLSGDNSANDPKRSWVRSYTYVSIC
jgi:hypothetical protein